MRAIRYNRENEQGFVKKEIGKSQSAMRAIRYNLPGDFSAPQQEELPPKSQSAMRAIRYNHPHTHK